MSCAMLFGLNAFLYLVPSHAREQNLQNAQRPNDTEKQKKEGEKKKKDLSPLRHVSLECVYSSPASCFTFMPSILRCSMEY